MTTAEQIQKLRLTNGVTLSAKVVRRQPAPRRQCLLIHGNPGSMADWNRVIQLLPTDVDVAALDLPGFGLSPISECKPTGVALRDLAEDVLALCDVLGWEKPVLVGHSHGAAIALALAAAFSKRVTALVLVSGLGSPTHLAYKLLAAPGTLSLMSLVAKTGHVNVLRPISDAMIRRSVADACFPEPPDPQLLQRSLDMFRSAPHTLVSMVRLALGNPSRQVLDAAARVTCPVAFLHGDSDALVPLSHAQNVHRRIVDSGGTSRFRTLTAAGHMLPLFQPEVVVEAIEAALKTQASPDHSEGDRPPQ